MKTLHLSILTGAGIVISIIIGISLMDVIMTPKLTENMKVGSDFCINQEYVTRGGDIFLICHHPANFTDTAFNLPEPEYKFTWCGGCGGGIAYVIQVPPNLLSEEQKQQVIEKVLQVTGLKNIYPDIVLDHFLIQARADHWFADVQFIIPHIMNGYGNCGWYTAANVDLNNLQVSPSDVPIGHHVC